MTHSEWLIFLGACLQEFLTACQKHMPLLAKQSMEMGLNFGAMMQGGTKPTPETQAWEWKPCEVHLGTTVHLVANFGTMMQGGAAPTPATHLPAPIPTPDTQHIEMGLDLGAMMQGGAAPTARNARACTHALHQKHNFGTMMQGGATPTLEIHLPAPTPQQPSPEVLGFTRNPRLGVDNL